MVYRGKDSGGGGTIFQAGGRKEAEKCRSAELGQAELVASACAKVHGIYDVHEMDSGTRLDFRMAWTPSLDRDTRTWLNSTLR